MSINTTPVLVLVAASTAPQAVRDAAEYSCDGIADQVEINLALAAVAATGGLVQLTPGTFNLSGTINFPGSVGMILRGSGWGTVLSVNNAMNGYAITFNPGGGEFVWGALIEDLKIAANGNNQSSGSGGISGKGAVWCRFNNLWINKHWGNGIWLRDDNNGSYGHHNVINAGLIDQGEQSNGGDGRAILFDQSDENLVTGGTTLQDNGRVGATERNHVYDLAGLNRADGVFVVGGGTAWKFQGPDGAISNLTTDGCKDHPIRVNGPRAQILGCHIYHVGFTGTNMDGIFVDNVAGTKIHDTTVDTIATVDAAGGTARSGINLSSGTVSDHDLRNNSLLNTGMAYGTGPVIAASGTGGRVLDNRGFNPQGPAAITVTASPFTYTAGPTPEDVFVSGGTVSSITKSGTTLGVTSGAFHLRPGQAIVVTYSSAPTMVKDRQ